MYSTKGTEESYRNELDTEITQQYMVEVMWVQQ